MVWPGYVFPPGEPVADRGGVCHFDMEGLVADHIARRRPAITIVAMFQPPEHGGGAQGLGHDLRWPRSPDGRRARGAERGVQYGAGDVIVIDSYRLHQIQPFGGERERISATVHAAEVDPGLWETWF